MAKKPKNGKIPKAPKGRGGNGGGKDPVTGLYVEFYLDDPNKRERYESDRTYSLDEINRAHSELGVPPETAFTSLSREFELSDRFLVQTNKTTYEDGYSAVERHIHSGDFKFNKGKLESATIKSVAEEIINFKDGIVEGRSGFINNANGSLKLPDASSFNAWLRINNSRQFTQQANYSFSMTEGKFHEGSTFDRNALASFGEGRFFQEGWWNNPFTPNLI